MTAILLVSSAALPLASIPAAFSFDAALIARAWTPVQITPLPPKLRLVAGKRGRAISDIDGEDASPRPKKRRLRLHLITSRLSRPFAAPSTYINSRGAFIAARLAFQRRVGRSLLRKAALENWMRVRRGAPTPGRRSLGGIEMTNGLGGWVDEGKTPDVGIHWAMRTGGLSEGMDHELSAPGLSNYNAIDLEENPFDEGSWSDAHEEMELDIYGSRPPDEILTDALGAMFQGSKRAWVAGDPIRSNPYWTVLTDEERHQEVSLAVFSKRTRM
jgi:hypothetical protein